MTMVCHSRDVKWLKQQFEAGIYISDVHLPDMSKVGRWIRSDGHLLDFLDLNLV